jgi:hypothetical protein
MATESTFVYDASFIAASDLSTSQFMVVSSSAAGYVDLCTASSGSVAVVTRGIGILQNNPTSGHAAIVRILGKSKAVASSSAAITMGYFVATTTWGALTTATTGAWVLGPAMTASTGGSGQLIEVLLNGPFQYISAGGTA